MTHIHYLKVDSDLAKKERIDKYIALRLPELSRSRIKGLIESGQVHKNGQTVSDCSYLVKPGDNLAIHVPPPTPSEMQPSDIKLKIVYEDDDLLVIDKPAGLTVHPGAGNHQDTMANALLAHCGDKLSGIGGVQRPGIVHRLDKDTSGLLVVAKNDAAHHSLSGQIAERSLKRTYLAVAWKVPSPRAGSIDGNLGRSPRNRKKMAVLRNGGKKAITHYKVIEIFGDGLASLVECRLETGRTHQIRVHLTHIGNSLIGDATYGSAHKASLSAMPAETKELVKTFSRQALHSCKIGFSHPTSDEWLEFTSELPEDMASLVKALRDLRN